MLVDGHMQKAAIRAVVHLAMIEAVANALLKVDNLLAPISKFVSSYIEEESIRIMKEDGILEFYIKIRDLPPLHPSSDPSIDDDIPSRAMKRAALVVARRTRRTRVCLLVLFVMECGA